VNKQTLTAVVITAIVAGAVGYGYARRTTVAPPRTPAPTATETLSGTRPGTGARPDSLPQSAATGGQVLIVKPGDVVQEAIARARPGDTVQILPGTYHETVYIDKDDIALVGIVHGGDWPTFDGEGKRDDAVLYSGNGLRVENLKIVNFKGHAIMGQAGNNFVIRHNWIANAGVHGIFPQFAQNGLIEYNVLSGIEDAAIFVGMSDNIHIAHNEVYGNVVGIVIENSRHALIEHNAATDNSAGILVLALPGLPITTAFDVIVRDNFIVANNHRNFSAPGSAIAGVPSGSGLIVIAADDVVVENNVIRDNRNAGIVVADQKFLTNVSPDPKSDARPNRARVLENLFVNNGSEPTKEIRALMLTSLTRQGPDLAVLGDGSGSCLMAPGMLKALGTGGWSQCHGTGSASTTTTLLEKPAPPRDFSAADRGELIYYSVCGGCHAYNVRKIGPPTQIIQAQYAGNAQGIADYIANPVKKRPDFPPMAPQRHLNPELRLAVAEYMLALPPPAAAVAGH
jgi:parallel beta-helix repeat protein